LLGLVLAFVTGEVVLRAVYGAKFGKRPNFIVSDPVPGWKLTPNLDHTFYGADFRIDVRTDAGGHRLGALGEVDFNRDLVLLCGDSNVFGWGVSTGETMPSYLDERLSGASGGAVRVVNLGVGSYGTLQYAISLQNFLKNHVDASIRAVVVVHAHNDAVDNIQSIGYHVGVWDSFDRARKKRSHSHVVNLVDYALRLAGQRRETADALGRDAADGLDPYLRDVLFGFSFKLPKQVPAEVDFDGRTVDMNGISELDYDKVKMFEQESLTRIQRELVLAGVESIHKALKGWDTTVLHVVLPTAPDWYVEETVTLVDRAVPSGDNRVVNAGRVPPDTDDFSGEIFNAHAGRHFTPEFNRYWTEKLAALLGALDV
jgi:hypothetical protein